MAEPAGDEPGLGAPRGSSQPPHCPPVPEPPGVVIQLTAACTEEEWGGQGDSELIFTLDRDEEGPAVAFSRDLTRPDAGQPAEDFLGSAAFSVSCSPSSPGSCGEFSILAPSFFSQQSSPRPFMSLVKSLSTEIEPKETASLKPRPLLSLVKSISTEISRSEPEVTQSKSDSRLNLHLWRQLTQPRGRNGDSKTAPPSPGSASPSEGKAAFFKVPEVEARLEDTKRKFSEAIQDPLSMLSKIMGDENSGSPKQKSGLTDSPGSSGGGCWGGQANGEWGVGGDAGTAGRNPRKGECDRLCVCSTPVRNPQRSQQKLCASPEPQCKVSSQGSRYEICTFRDIMQVVEIEPAAGTPGTLDAELAQGLPGEQVSLQPCPPVPGKCLFSVAALAYSYFVLPLPPYLSGLALGLACGFMLGLLLILLLAPRTPLPSSRIIPPAADSRPSASLAREGSDPEVMKGWMNEMYVYDPETYHPSLTHSVFVTLEGSTLRLAYPRSNIPRRATFDEPPHDVIFVSARCFRLAHSQVFLVPTALARKRMWNKKYPICIVLGRAEEGTEDSQPEGLSEEQRVDTLTDGVRRGEGATSTLEHPAAPPGPTTTLYLFGRTGREKEVWFQNFLSASKRFTEDQDTPTKCGSKFAMRASSPSSRVLCSGGSSRGSTEDISSLFRLRDLAGSVREKILLDYSTYMARFIMPESTSALPSPCNSAASSPTARRKLLCEPHGGSTEGQSAWINALIGRIFWDFLREKYWADQVAYRIQKKLSKIRLPYFMNELTLTELDMGSSMPQVISTSKPSVNYRGLWLELEIMYTGCLQMTLETKMNLCKLGKEIGGELDSVLEPSREGSRPRLCVLADSDEESSSAGSSDEEEVLPSEPQGILGERATPPGAEGHVAGGSTSRKILRFVDKIAKSKYFQKATENEYIKKKIEEVSNTPLLLTVEVQELSGLLAVNIPPPPTDRIWYSFCVPPRLDLRVRPKLGEREVTFTHVTEWIERKLQHEFQKVLVMPNMDDLYLPLMHSGLAYPPGSQPAQPEEMTRAEIANAEE
ncbi:testis-expressed protein 2 [Lepisosteus oculatus]|uniref:testis-expressed protein 2 n=1 Tax=Lepisosteus oculatus TaxID=7918 RepID=UPI0035F5078B